MAEVPSGTVTFLFTDIEGSTRLWEEHPVAMEQALVVHDRIMRDAIARNGGYVFSTGGDSFAAAFQHTHDGLRAATDAQLAMNGEDWAEAPISVRMALHTGEAQERDGDYFGRTLNRTARLMSAGHGGQVLISRSAYEIGNDHPPGDVEFDDLGDHRLKDLDRAERIFQLRHPALPADFPDLVTIDARPNNLPVQLTSFIGREEALTALVGALGETRLLTVTGVGGSGKTRLALQAAAEVLTDYPGGVWLVELAEVLDPGLVIPAIAEVLAVQDSQGRSLIESVAGAIGDRELLMMLDNCEHLVDAAAGAAAGLLERCVNLRIVATSRELLGVPGEVPFRTDSLALPLEEGSGDVIADFDAVRLFAERAATAKPGFHVTDVNAVGVARICRRLEGMPLAIELAAARVPVMSPEQIATRLDDRFTLLTGGARTVRPRQRTLQATIDWSYQLLDHDEQTVFQNLSVFVGGFAPDTAELAAATDAITGFAVIGLIHRLADKSLVVRGEEADGSVRFRMLETIRQFAAEELLAAGRADAARRRHAETFASLASELAEPLLTDEEGSVVSLLTLEHDNFRAALRWSIDHEEIAMVTALAMTLGRYWARRGLSMEAVRWLSEILDLMPDEDSADLTAMLRVAGSAKSMVGAYDDGASDFRRALEISTRLGDDDGRMRALNSLAIIADSTGRYDDEQRYLEEALDLAQAPHHRMRSIIMANLGWTAFKSDDPATGRERFDDAFAEAELADGAPIHDFLLGLGWVTWAEGDFAAAEDLAWQAVREAERRGEPANRAGYLFSVAAFAHDGGRREVAEDALRDSFPVLLEAAEDHWLNHWLWAAARAQTDVGVAARILGTQAALAERTGFVFGIPIRRDRDRRVERLRDAFGRGDFDQAWAEGQAATVEQAGAWALEGLEV